MGIKIKMFKTVAAVIGLMTATQALDIQSENELAILAEGQSDIASYLMDDDDKKGLVESFKGLKLNQRDATEEPFVPSAEPKEWPADTEEEKTEDSMETEEDSRSPLPGMDMATELVINEKEENLFVY